jgi:hypothetical protein
MLVISLTATAGMSSGRIVLLGDSAFDNQSYVAPGASTIAAIEARLPAGWSAILLAQDGSTIDEVTRQAMQLPAGATHLVVSSGMSDVLSDIGMLAECAATVADALWNVAQIAERFEHRYRRMLRSVRARRLPVAVCTLGNGDFGGPQMQAVTTTALGVFNDVIIRSAWSSHVPIIDLRAACDDPEDYANETVPSARGSGKIAEMVVNAIAGWS